MSATVGLPVSRLVNVGLQITPQAVQAPSLNTGLVLGTSTVIDTVQRMRQYATLGAIATDFGTTAEEYLAAELWFAQSPQPTSMYVGRWCKTAAAGTLQCGALPPSSQLITAWNTISTGSFKLAVDGGPATNVPAMNFTGATTLQGVAAIIQTAIQGLGGSYAAVTCVYNATYVKFVITSGTTGANSAVAFLTAGTTGTDISGLMQGLASDAATSGAYVANGVAAESAIAAVTLFDNEFSGQWYNLFVPDAVDTDQQAIAPYIDGAATPHFNWINSQEAAMLSSGNTTAIGYLLQQLESQHSAIQYSSTSLYAVWSMAARIATVDWDGQNTAISLMYKTEPSVTPETLTVNQVNNLESYNVNVYVTYQYGSAVSIIEPGICPSGQFIDTIIGSDGLRLQIQQNIFNLLYGSSTKVPQTDDGVNQLETAAESACEQYVVNGFLAAGVWTGTTFGQLTYGQWLDKGYYVYAQPIANQSQSQRAARVSPPIQIAAKCAGAIDTVSVTVYVND